MADFKKLKKHAKHTVYVRPDSMLSRVLRVISVAGELGSQSIYLFGVNEKGENKYSRVKRILLNDVIYRSAVNEFLYEGVGFTERGKGQYKTIRPKMDTIVSVFNSVPEGQELIANFTWSSLPSSRDHVGRNIKLAEILIICLRTGVSFDLIKNPTIYDTGALNSQGSEGIGIVPNRPRKVEKTIFYPMKEVRKRDSKVGLSEVGSRSYGYFVTTKGVYECFNLNRNMCWNYKTEENLAFYTKLFAEINFGFRFNFEPPNAICFTNSYEDAQTVIYNSERMSKGNGKFRTSETSKMFKDVFSNTYCFIKNEEGIKQFELFLKPEFERKIANYFLEEGDNCIESAKRCTFRCSAFESKDRVAYLFFFGGNMNELYSCYVAKTSGYFKFNSKLVIYCYPHQEAYIDSLFKECENVEIVVKSLEEIEDVFCKNID